MLSGDIVLNSADSLSEFSYSFANFKASSFSKSTVILSILFFLYLIMSSFYLQIAKYTTKLKARKNSTSSSIFIGIICFNIGYISPIFSIRYRL